MPITNAQVAGHRFLAEMYDDPYFPDPVVDKGRAILVRLCERIEAERPATIEAAYRLTHAATEAFNDLEAEFHENDSEIETAARDCIASNVEFVLEAYGFEDFDLEEAIAPREW